MHGSNQVRRPMLAELQGRKDYVVNHTILPSPLSIFTGFAVLQFCFWPMPWVVKWLVLQRKVVPWLSLYGVSVIHVAAHILVLHGGWFTSSRPPSLSLVRRGRLEGFICCWNTWCYSMCLQNNTFVINIFMKTCYLPVNCCQDSVKTCQQMSEQKEGHGTHGKLYFAIITAHLAPYSQYICA